MDQVWGSQVLDQVWWCLTRDVGENKCSGPGVGISGSGMNEYT